MHFLIILSSRFTLSLKHLIEVQDFGKFNASLLADLDCVRGMNKMIAQIKQEGRENDPSLLWEQIKLSMIENAQWYAKKKA